MPLVTILGKWRGGPNGNIITVAVAADGVVRGSYKGKNGGEAAFEGNLIEKGKGVRGYWYDVDAGITGGNRYECTCLVMLDDGDSNLLKLKYKQKGGGEETYEAKRYSEAAAVPREDGKIKGFVMKDPQIFARVTDNLKDKKAQLRETGRVEALEASVSRPLFDGRLTYVPSPAVGAEYMTQYDVERKLKHEDELRRPARIAAYEAQMESLKAKVAAGDDNAKAKLALTEKLLRGEKGGEKLDERPVFKRGLHGTEFQSGPIEHLPEPYITEVELMRSLHKADEARPKQQLASFEEELPKLQAKIAAGEGDVDGLKKRLAYVQSSIKAIKGLEKLEERHEFRPTNRDAASGMSKALEHLPEPYMSAVGLERHLKAKEAARGEQTIKALEAEIEKLQKKAADGSIDDIGKRRLEIAQKLLKGEKVAMTKLVERPTFKAGAGDPTATRLSSTVMLHPLNVRKALH